MPAATSVVIPCYNGEEFLFQALESVRTQSAPVREIVLVDDGSTVPLRAPLGWSGPPLRIIRTPNRGLAAARNLGWSQASGEFVAFLDADDVWRPRKVEEQEKALREDSTAVACFTQCVEAPGYFGFGPYPPPDVSDDEFLLVFWYNAFFPPSAVMIRRDHLAAVGGFREGMGNGEDHELWMRLLQRGRFVQVAEPLCFYRQHQNQLTQDPVRKHLGGKEARAVMIGLHADRLIQAGLRRDKLWDAYRNDILLVFYRRQFPAARRLLWNYWRDHPLDLRVLCRALVAMLPAELVRRLRGGLSLPASATGEQNGSALDARALWSKATQRLRPVLARP
jgi:glycosyltransferase involved in cell wall biosynthesis